MFKKFRNRSEAFYISLLAIAIGSTSLILNITKLLIRLFAK